MAAFTEAWLAGPKSTQIYTRTYPAVSSPAKACLVFVHGFIEHVARHEHMHKLWASRGVIVFAFDQRGFGRTALDQTAKSKSSAYGKTSYNDHLADIDWAVKHAKKEVGNLPLFLMGHSMGGALTLAFATRSTPPPEPATATLLAGVIATSPLILGAVPAPKVKRWVGEKVAKIRPYMLIPIEVKAEELCHDKDVVKAYEEDPMVVQSGSLRGVSDMINGGEKLLRTDYQHWPKKLPVLLIHGTEDKVTSVSATEEFYNKIQVTDKKLSLYEGGYHELQNEPNGVKEKLFEECIGWVMQHLAVQSTQESKL